MHAHGLAVELSHVISRFVFQKPLHRQEGDIAEQHIGHLFGDQLLLLHHVLSPSLYRDWQHRQPMPLQNHRTNLRLYFCGSCLDSLLALRLRSVVL